MISLIYNFTLGDNPNNFLFTHTKEKQPFQTNKQTNDKKTPLLSFSSQSQKNEIKCTLRTECAQANLNAQGDRLFLLNNLGVLSGKQYVIIREILLRKLTS